MKKCATLASILSAIFALIFLSGCFSPPHGIAFSSDGKRIIYLDHARDGLVMRDLAAGKSVQLYKSIENYRLFGVFWPAGKNDVYFVEAGGDDCSKDGKETTFLLKHIIPAAGETAKTIAKTQHACPKKDDPNNGVSFTTSDPALLMSLFSTSFDPNTLTAFAGGVLIRKDDKTPSPFAGLPNSTDTLVLNPTASPDGQYVAYYFASVADAMTLASGGAQNKAVPLELKLLHVPDGKSATISRIQFGDDGGGKEALDTLMMILMSGVRWKPDSSALFFQPIAGQAFSLARYNVADAHVTSVVSDSVLAFDIFASGDRLLVLPEKSGKQSALIVREDGTVESDFTTLFPDRMGHSLTVGPDGANAAAMFTEGEGDDAVMLPLLYDFKAHTEQLLVFHDEDRVAAGNIFFRHDRFKDALALFRAAGQKGLVGAWLASLHVESGAGQADYDAALKSFPGEDSDPHVEMAKAAVKYKQYDVAEKEFLKAEGPGKTFIPFQIAEMFYNEQLFARALPYYEKVLVSFQAISCYKEDTSDCDDYWQDAVDVPLKIARCLAEAGRLDEAVTHYEALEKDFPMTAKGSKREIMENLADLYEQTRNCPKALTTWRSLQQLQEDKPNLWHTDMERAEGKQKIDDAIARLGKQCK
jgi:tetratricopeptide (TPR) repeat protein